MHSENGRRSKEEHKAEHSNQNLDLKTMRHKHFSWTDSFSFHKHSSSAPTPKENWSIMACCSDVFSRFLLAHCFATSTNFGHCLFSLACLATCPGLCSTVMTSRPCLSCQVDLMLRGPLFVGPLLSHGCPYRTLINSCERFPILAHIKGRPGKLLGASVQRSRTSQTILNCSMSPIHFPLLLPHRYPWEKTNLQKNSPAS